MTSEPMKMVDGVLIALTGDELAEWQSAMENAGAEALEVLKNEILSAAQAELDAFARTRGYDGILSACTYATSTVPKFAAEGQYCVQLRDATWAALYTMLAQVEAGIRSVPSGFSEIAADLPTLEAEWPN